MIALPIFCVLLLIYGTVQAIRARMLERDILELINAGIRASDDEQRRSIDC